jgi:hypothetical protein
MGFRKRLRQAIKQERKAADLYYYFDGTNNTREEYELAKAQTDGLVNSAKQKKSPKN